MKKVYFSYIGFGFLVGFFLWSAVILLFTNRNSLIVSFQKKSPQTNITTPLKEPDPINLKSPDSLGILLVGYGGAGHDGGYLTDAIQILHIDFKKSVIALISIPRDLWIKSDKSGEMKINNVLVSAATDKKELVKSGAPAMKQILTQITGLPIHYFIGVDFVGYQRAIGLALKGIEVEVAETLEDPWYPIKGEELNLCGKSPEEMQEVHAKYSGFELERQFECRYKHLLFEKGKVKMQGEQALEYVRSRHGSSEGDVARGKRQQEVLKAVKDRVISLDGFRDLPKFFSEIATHTTTDIDAEIVSNLAPFLKNATKFKIVSINLSPSNVFVNSKSNSGAFIMLPKEGDGKWEDVQTFVQNSIEN